MLFCRLCVCVLCVRSVNCRVSKNKKRLEECHILALLVGGVVGSGYETIRCCDVQFLSL